MNEPLPASSIRKSSASLYQKEAAKFQKEAKGPGVEATGVESRNDVHGDADFAGQIYGAAEVAKNAMAVLYVQRNGEPDTEFIGLVSQLMGKIARFCANPDNADAYADAYGYIELIRKHVERVS